MIPSPEKQLLITEHNVQEIANRMIYVKKRGMTDPRIVENLRHLVERANQKSSPKRMLALFEARKKILETASEIYAMENEESLFNECTDELAVVIQMIKDYTIIR